MAKTVNIPGGAVGTRIAEAFAGVYGYTEKVADPKNPNEMIDNPVTKEDFAVEQIQRYVSDTVASYEGNQAGDTARASAIEKAKKEVKLT